MKPEQVLKRYWGYKSFRPLQEQIIQATLASKDVLAVLPTGGGKSLCFQVPTLMQEGLCVVVTPLIALMKDQVANLVKRDISAISIDSSIDRRAVDIALDNCIYGHVKFLYISPERIQTEIFKQRVKQMNVNLIAVDEAHCISQWGHDFRPSYLLISDLRELLPGINCIALTASATEPVRTEIIEKLGLGVKGNLETAMGSFARSNLSYGALMVEDKEIKLVSMINQMKGSAIVYVKTRKQAKEVSDTLKKKEISSNYYHAGMSNKQRDEVQMRWTKGNTRVVVATNAFGMGIDKPDVRMVLHYGIRANMESYYQEAGRAGRDGKYSRAVILYQKKDIGEEKEQLLQAYPPLKDLQHVYQCLANYYKLAVGSEHGSGNDFVLNEFASRYNLVPTRVYYALKRLGEEGLIRVSETDFGSSAIFISIDHNALYKFQVANAHFDPLLKAILRMYGGELFTQFTQISEFKLSRMLTIKESQIKQDLNTLHNREILVYAMRKEKPQLTFLTPRIDAKKIITDRRQLYVRKNHDLDKLDFMIRYTMDSTQCRTQAIQEYFGEISMMRCGKCDNCTMDQIDGGGKADFIDKKIIRMAGQPSTVEAIVNALHFGSDRNVLEHIRILVDRGDLKYLSNGMIVRS